MDFAQSFAISAAGMGVERTRVEVAAMNLANANTVQGPAGRYVVQRVIAEPVTTDRTAGAATAAFASLVDQALSGTAPMDTGLSLPQARVIAADAPARRVHDPAHPLADAQGFIAYPGVDPAVEMVGMMSATRAYEANVAAMNTAKTLALRALEIGGGNA